MTTLTRQRPRRNNAPIRPPRQATPVLPDLLVALAATGFTMALLFAVASYVQEDITAGDAGPVLARMFAAALAVSALFALLLALVILRDDRGDSTHYVAPGLVGIVVATLETALFLEAAGALILTPLPLLVFAFRPVRRALAALVPISSGGRR